MAIDTNFLERRGIIENHQGLSHRFGRIAERIGRPTPLSFIPWEFHRRDRYVYGDHVYVDGYQYYYVGSFDTRDEAVEWAQQHIDERSKQFGTEELGGRAVEFTQVALNLDGTPPSVVVTFKNGKYNVLSDDTTNNYQRQQELLKAWRESVAKDDPEIFRIAYWGTGERFLREENDVDTSTVPQEIIDLMSKVGFAARTSEDERNQLIGSIFERLNELRREAGAEPIEPPVKPLVSGDARPGRIARRPVRVRGHRRRA
jgi:hypothetical protein